MVVVVVVCDGSKLGSTIWAQTGWAAMAVDPEGRATTQAWGPLPVDLPTQRTIKRAELWGFLQVLRHIKTEAMGASEPCVTYTDHLAIVLGLRRGRAWCGNGKRGHADVWRQVRGVSGRGEALQGAP